MYAPMSTAGTYTCATSATTWPTRLPGGSGWGRVNKAQKRHGLIMHEYLRNGIYWLASSCEALRGHRHPRYRAAPRRWGYHRCPPWPTTPTTVNATLVPPEQLRRRATALGLLQVLNNANIADDATLQKSMAFCDKHGVTKVSDVVEFNLVDDFVRHLTSQPEDRPGSEAAQNAANPKIWSRHPFERRERRGRRAAPQTAAPRRAAPRRAAPRRAPHDGQRRRLEVRSYGARPQWP